MSEFDPEVLKRGLPADVHGLIDQVKANVDLAVNQIVQEFKTNAAKVVTDFQNQNYSEELNAAIQKHQDEFDHDVKTMEETVTKLSELVEKADKAVKAANAEASALGTAVADLQKQSGDLQTKLNDFKAKTANFGQKVGGAIATAAVKTFTGGIG